MNTVQKASPEAVRRERTREKREEATLKKAAAVIRRLERLEHQKRVNEMRLRSLCRTYDEVSGFKGFTSAHIRRACEARGFIEPHTPTPVPSEEK